MTTSATSAARRKGRARLVIATAWALLGLMACSLFLLAGFLLFRTNIFSDEVLTDEEMKSLWTFLGVALGAVATLIGTLMTEQASRRTEHRERTAAKQQRQQNAEAERRLTLDTRAKVLELVTNGSEYAPPARVGGAVATMMELRGGPIAIRLLGDLWASNNIGTATAVWLIDQILRDEKVSPAEKEQATALLSTQVSKLLPPEDEDQDWYEWPDFLDADPWPATLPARAKNGVILSAIKLLLSRDPDYWLDGGAFPLETLYRSREDPEVQAMSAPALEILIDAEFAQRFINIDESEIERIRAFSAIRARAAWVQKLHDRLRSWVRREDFSPMVEHHSASAIPSPSNGPESA